MSFSRKRDRVRVVSKPVGASLTKPSMAKDCDVNNILKKYAAGGPITHVNKAVPQFLDVSAVHGYQDALNVVIAAQQAFADLPSKVRARFNNNPGELVAFCENPANAKEAIELGLIEDKVIPSNASDSAGIAPKGEPAGAKATPVPAAGEGPKT